MSASFWIEAIDGEEIASTDSSFASSVTEKVCGEEVSTVYANSGLTFDLE